ncbi:MAG: 4-alpha-glucanotransferase [Bacteroidales bacterium]
MNTLTVYLYNFVCLFITARSCSLLPKTTYMIVQFNLEYHTRWGQSIWIKEVNDISDTLSLEEAIPLTYKTNGMWQTEIRLENTKRLSYKYFIREKGRNDLFEDGLIHNINTSGTSHLILFDQWQQKNDDKPFFSSAFTKCIFHSDSKLETSEIAPDSVSFVCYAPSLKKEEILKLCGDNQISGNWNPAAASVMKKTDDYEWTLTLPIEHFHKIFNFKFIICNQEGKLIDWEGGDNRSIRIPESIKTGTTLYYTGYHLKDLRPRWRGAGVAIPVFSLRSNEGYGVGEFLDLIPLIDWAVKTGQRIIQILPINDTTMSHSWHDSYPYNANSIFALHPAYIRLEEVGRLKSSERMEEFRRRKASLNNLHEIDYEAVTALKWSYLQEIFSEKADETFQSEDYIKFFENNKEWLIPYASFSFLRDKYNTPDFHWWEEFSTFNREQIEEMYQKESGEHQIIKLHCFIQYHLDKQLRAVSTYARGKGIIIKGDIPIGISRTSADAWLNPQLFQMNCQAGAPPDDFSKLGQNWGFPTYDWEEMKKDHFSWWKKRFTKMSEYFDAYRIDHILGFFRIWEIPIKSTQGIMGYFNPALPYSEQEISSFGFHFDKELMTKPYIREYYLNDIFGDMADIVKNTFLDYVGNDIFVLKKEFDTQLEIENYFNGQNDERALRIRKGLLDLVADILFIPEKKDGFDTGKLHPRIIAWETHVYKSLNPDQRCAFDKLYNHYFYERHNEFWCREAYSKLPHLLEATHMLACGEDLGMIPAGVEKVMKDLRILSLEIQRMPKKEGVLFDDPNQYPYLSVCTTSTHDMSTLREWWEENRDKSQLYYNQILHREGLSPNYCTADICEQIIMQHLLSPAMFTILPWQDWIAIDGELRRQNPYEERINQPAIARHYWRYRMHIPLEELLKKNNLNNHIRSLIETSGRSE